MRIASNSSVDQFSISQPPTVWRLVTCFRSGADCLQRAIASSSSAAFACVDVARAKCSIRSDPGDRAPFVHTLSPTTVPFVNVFAIDMLASPTGISNAAVPLKDAASRCECIVKVYRPTWPHASYQCLCVHHVHELRNRSLHTSSQRFPRDPIRI
jgi:hypothetical protein